MLARNLSIWNEPFTPGVKVVMELRHYLVSREQELIELIQPFYARLRDLEGELAEVRSAQRGVDEKMPAKKRRVSAHVTRRAAR